jgi:hypothetical protein
LQVVFGNERKAPAIAAAALADTLEHPVAGGLSEHEEIAESLANHFHFSHTAATLHDSCRASGNGYRAWPSFKLMKILREVV